MTERKKGKVKGFLDCSSDYLKLINEDLGLNADPALMCYLQKIYKEEKREPTVTELYFAVAALKHSCRLRDAVLLSDLKCDNADCMAMFNAFAKEAASFADRNDSGLAYTSMAEYAATGESTEALCTYQISGSEKPVFNSTVSNRMIYWQTSDYRLSFSPEVPRHRCDVSDCAVIITRPEDMPEFRYTQITEKLLCDYYEYDRSATVYSCSEEGLIYDLLKAVGPCSIMLSDLPGNPELPEELFGDFSGSVIVSTMKNKAERLCLEASKAGLYAVIPVTVVPDDKNINIFSAYEPLTLSTTLFEKYRLFRKVRANADSAFIGKAGKCEKQLLTSPADCDIDAYKLEGDLFAPLSELVSGAGNYCLAGTVNPDSPDTVPFILSILAFRKKNRALDYAKFYIGNQNSAVLFRIGATGKVQKLERPAIPEKADSPEACSPEAEFSSSFSLKNNTAESIEQLVGNTPMLHIHQDKGAKVYAKLEMFNPAGSAKDRPAIEMLNQAEASGELTKGGTVIEATSGNTGIGLACYGTVRGYKVKIIMPDTMSKERIDLIRAYGAEVILTPGAEGMKGSSALAEKLHAEIPGSVIAGQFSNHANPDSHFKTTGPEIWRDLGGKIDILVAGVGTGGTLCGTAKYLKKMNPGLKVIAAEPASSPLLSRGYAGAHKIQGIGANFIPENYDASIVDGIIAVSDEDAINETVRIARTHGLLCGISSGCASFAAGIIASQPANAGKTIVTIFPDTGEHYLSTGIFN